MYVYQTTINLELKESNVTLSFFIERLLGKRDSSVSSLFNKENITLSFDYLLFLCVRDRGVLQQISYNNED